MVINIDDIVILKNYGTGVVVQTKEYIGKLTSNSGFEEISGLGIYEDALEFNVEIILW